jgi:hypothetical protein
MSSGSPASLTSIAYGTGELMERRRIIQLLTDLAAVTGNVEIDLDSLTEMIQVHQPTAATKWALSYPAPGYGLHLAQVLPAQDEVQQVVQAASEAGRQLERGQIVRLLQHLNTPLETIQAVTNGEHS